MLPRRSGEFYQPARWVLAMANSASGASSDYRSPREQMACCPLRSDRPDIGVAGVLSLQRFFSSLCIESFPRARYPNRTSRLPTQNRPKPVCFGAPSVKSTVAPLIRDACFNIDPETFKHSFDREPFEFR